MEWRRSWVNWTQRSVDHVWPWKLLFFASSSQGFPRRLAAQPRRGQTWSMIGTPETTKTWPIVGNPTINLPFGGCLYHPLCLFLSTPHYCFWYVLPPVHFQHLNFGIVWAKCFWFNWNLGCSTVGPLVISSFIRFPQRGGSPKWMVYNGHAHLEMDGLGVFLF